MPFDPDGYDSNFCKTVAPLYGAFSFFALILFPLGFAAWFMLMLMTGQFKDKNRIQEEPSKKSYSTTKRN